MACTLLLLVLLLHCDTITIYCIFLALQQQLHRKPYESWKVANTEQSLVLGPGVLIMTLVSVPLAMAIGVVHTGAFARACFGGRSEVTFLWCQKWPLCSRRKSGNVRPIGGLFCHCHALFVRRGSCLVALSENGWECGGEEFSQAYISFGLQVLLFCYRCAQHFSALFETEDEESIDCTLILLMLYVTPGRPALVLHLCCFATTYLRIQIIPSMLLIVVCTRPVC